MIILQDSQIKKIFHNGDEVKKILDWDGNVVFVKESAPVMTNTIKFHTNSSVSGYKYFTISYTDSTYNVIDYSEPNKQYTAQIPTDKTVNALDFDSSLVDEVIVSCKINLSDTFFSTITPNTIRFLNCDATASTSLSSVFTSRSKSVKLFEIRNLDARNATSMKMFLNNSKGIESIVMRDLNVSKVTDMSNMFSNCYSATTIDIANWDTSSVTNLGNAFKNCNKVTTIDLSSWNTSNVNNMYGVFDYCTSLTSLNLSNWDTSKVTHMSFMFEKCQRLISLDLSHFNTGNVYSMPYIFSYCTRLESLDISGWDMTNVTNMGGMFESCNKLKTIKMIGCNQITIDKIKSALTDAGILNQVTIITGDVPMTNYIKFTTSPSVASENNVQVTYADSTQDTVSYSEPSKEYSLSIPTDKVVTKIDFDNTMVDEVKVSCNVNLSETFFTNKPKTIRILNCDATSSTSLSNLFSGATSTEIIMKDLDVRNATDMSGMFYDCGMATTIGIANCNTSKVTNMVNMFKYCTSLTSLDLSNFNTSNVTGMINMFGDCYSLTSLDLSGWDTSKLTDIIWMFSNCNKLKTISMRGCNQTTIDKIKDALSSAGILNNVTIVT